jgi:hypothetical protein
MPSLVQDMHTILLATWAAMRNDSKLNKAWGPQISKERLQQVAECW